jgi:hypothetical protein
MAAPAIVFRVFYHPGAHRIEVNVPNQFQEIAIGIDENSLVPALKQMLGPLSLRVLVPGVAKTQILDNP